MYGILHPTQPFLPTSDATRADLEGVTVSFLRQAQRSAIARFRGDARFARGCHTAQVIVSGRPGVPACTGAIVAHVSPALVRAWGASVPGTARQRKDHVLGQLQLVLHELSDHDMHGYLALTASQCQVYGDDLAQLVQEGLARTTFATLGLASRVQWEGTLVRSLQPPSFVLVISIAS